MVYLFVRGTRTGEAEAVLAKDSSWAAPLLWRSEFRNALVGLVRRGDLLLDEAVQFVKHAELWMRGREYLADSSRIMEFAAESGCSAYDCEFAATAHDLGIPLVTADRQIVRAFPSLAIHPAEFAA
jgi:predicted nucleic acid-binding protein